MKAIKKAYRKANWLDTRYSRHYLKAITSARISFNMRASVFVSGANVQYRNILHTPVDSTIEKKKALSDCMSGLHTGLKTMQDMYSDELILIGRKYGVSL